MKNKLILLVEDNPDDEILTLRTLRKEIPDCGIVVKHDGAEALEYLLGLPASAADDQTQLVPSLVLLDLKLPKIDGHEVLRRLRANPATKTLPVVVLTSSREESDVAASYGNGANSYIRKPVDFTRFTEVVRHLGVYWLIVNEPPLIPKTKI